MSNKRQRGYSPLTGEGAPNNPPSGGSSGKKYDDGLPAFPRPYVEGEQLIDAGHIGMSLRDWFAGQAPIKPEDAQKTFDTADVSYGDVFRRLAQMRYAYADAMIAARKAGES